MVTISTLRNLLKAKRREKDDLVTGVYRDPAVIKAREAYNKVTEIYHSIIKPKRELLEKEISEIDKKLDDLLTKKELEIPTEVTEFLGKLYSGCDWGSNGFTVKWVSPSKKFIIATNGGSTYSSGMDRKYGQSNHYLFDITRVGKASHGIEVKRNCEIFTCAGRLKKETVNEWKEYANKEESNG